MFRKYFEKHGDRMDDWDVYELIKKSLRDGDVYEYGGNRSHHPHHYDSEYRLRELAKLYERICDFFEVQNLDIRSYLDDNYRKNNPNAR